MNDQVRVVETLTKTFEQNIPQPHGDNSRDRTSSHKESQHSNLAKTKNSKKLKTMVLWGCLEHIPDVMEILDEGGG
jgi:hypothetical protein